MPHVKLHDLIAGLCPTVGHIHAHRHRTVGREVVGTQAQVAVSKGGVTQAKAERVEWLPL